MRHSIGPLWLAALASAAALSCRRGGEGAAPARKEIRYDGAASIARHVLPPLAPLLRERTGLTVLVERSGAGIGLRRVLAGEVDVAGVSRSLARDEIAQQPYFQIIGYDALGIWVSDANPLRNLTRSQIEAIFTGAARRWSEVGGKDVPIAPCTEKLDSARATLDVVRTVAMGGKPYGNVKQLELPPDCLAFVASDPRGIAAATISLKVPGVHAVAVDGVAPERANMRSGRYLLTRPLLLVTRARPAPEDPVAALFDVALSPQGQAAIAAAGFVPAR